MLISDNREVNIGDYKFIINGYLDGHRENKWNREKNGMDYNLFNIWHANTVPTDPKGVYLYTRARENKTKKRKMT